MTGTGTQADPYVVDNEADFRTAIAKSGVYVQCVPNMVIDLNDRSPYADSFIVMCAELEGNGLIIQNGRFEDYVLSCRQPSSIKNINILDCASTRQSDAASILYCIGTRPNFHNCTFRTQSVAGCLCYDASNGYPTFYSCNIVIRKARLGYMQNAQTTCYDCNIFMYDSGTLCATLEFCYLSGKYTGINYCNLKNCILEPEEEIPDPLSNTSSVTSSGCVWNKDRIKGWKNAPNSPGKGLTTEEIRNRQKLYEAGMLINPTEG